MPSAISIKNKGKQKDYTHYRLNGCGNYGKGRLALAIVKQFVKDNPHLSFYYIKNSVPLDIEEYSEIKKWKETAPDSRKETRWFEDEGDLMVSADGVTFAFTTQIGRGNIGKMIEFGEKQGYTIEPIS